MLIGNYCKFTGSRLLFFTDVLPLYNPVHDVADSCRTGTATNVIYLDLRLAANQSSFQFSQQLLASTLALVLLRYMVLLQLLCECLAKLPLALLLMHMGLFSDNTGGIAEMTSMSHRIRERESMHLMLQEAPLLQLERYLYYC